MGVAPRTRGDLRRPETLAADELSEITGAKTHDGQRTWLDANRWKYHTNRAGRPIVGRMYARLKMAGIEAAAQGAQQISVAAERQTQTGMETVTPIQGGVLRRHVIR